MEDYESYCKTLSTDKLKEEIFKLTRPTDKSHPYNLTFALGTYMLKLQEDSNYAPIFPIDLAPIPKYELRKWGQEYAQRVLLAQGGLQKYQVDGALCYTSFQNIVNSQWDKIKSGQVENLLLYVEEFKKSGKSHCKLPDEYKELADAYIEEYKREKSELFGGLDKFQKKFSGCYILTIVLIVVLASIIWYFFI